MKVENLKLEELQEIYKKKDSCIKKLTTSYSLRIHPRFLKDIKGGVKWELDSLLQTYFHEFKGILMGYEAVKVFSNSGWVFEASPFVHINIEATFYVFAPEIGNAIEGKVVKKSATHLSFLIHRIFNASSYIPPNVLRNDWCGGRVNEEDAVKIKITYINLASFVPYLRGDIIEESIPCPIVDSKDNIHTFFDEEDDSGISSVDKPITKSPKKKKHKERSSEESFEQEIKKEEESFKSDIQPALEVMEVKKRKKKLKKEKEIKQECDE